jgi:hypothetical protein
MTKQVRLAFLGGATVYQGDKKFEVIATVFAEGTTLADSFFGHYEMATPDGIEDGVALMRFSDGSEADAILAVVDPENGGVRITSGLRDLSRGA